MRSISAFFTLIATTALLTACASGPTARGHASATTVSGRDRPRAPLADTPYAMRVQQEPLPMPSAIAPADRTVPVRDSTLLLGESVRVLVPDIGGYPPRYASEAERKALYALWSGLLVEARAAALAEGQSENARYLLAELYRMGNNMLVLDAGLAAQREIHACLQRFPQSVGCHFSAVRYHLGVAPMRLDAAEVSLKVLREQFGANFNEEVERGFVFLSLYRGEHEQALRRIDDFVAMFPQSPSVAHMETMRTALEQGELRMHVAK